MCGRFVQVFDAHALERLRDLLIGAAYFDDALIEELARIQPGSYNIAPTQTAGIIHRREEPDRLAAAPGHFGLIPSWAKDRSISSKMINARSETIWEKPAYRGLIRDRRSVLAINGFYEWQTIPAQRTKQPWYIRRADESPMLLGCVWDTWCDPQHHGSPLDSFSIITTDANRQLSDMHHRMPVILEPESLGAWFDHQTPPGEISGILAPAAEGVLAMHRVSARVNTPSNNDASLIEPDSQAGPATLWG